MAPASKTDEPIKLYRLPEEVVAVEIEGATPLIPHRWSEKSLRLMRDKQTGATASSTRNRDPKVPEREAYDSCYWLKVETPGGVKEVGAMPAPAFKAAIVGGARFFESLSMAAAKSLFYVEGEGPDQLVPIAGNWIIREDTPRNASGVADLRYRMMFGLPWSATLHIRYIPTQIDPESILNLVDAGGRGGVGDWRPSSPKSHTGSYGQFRVCG
jgi:hypothetical protein